MDKKTLLKELNNIEFISSNLQGITTFNNTQFSLVLGQKMVFQLDEDDKIYRLSRPEDYFCRSLIKEFCASRDCDIFLEEILEYQSKKFCLSSQEKIEVATPLNYMLEFNKYCNSNELKKCFIELGILDNDFLHRNMGYDKNKRLKVFDFISNVAVQIIPSESKAVLYNQYAEVIYESNI